MNITEALVYWGYVCELLTKADELILWSRVSHMTLTITQILNNFPI
jgi:hypothetical protein